MKVDSKRRPAEAPGAVDSASLGEDRKSRPSSKDQVEGEGSYSGTKDYNARTGEFLKSGKVDEAARKASPQSEEEARAMEKAERIGKQRAKGEDPALRDRRRSRTIRTSRGNSSSYFRRLPQSASSRA